MKIPKEIKIGGHLYKIDITKNEEFPSCGRLDRSKGIISIKNSLIQSEKEETLIHEIFHAINNEINETLLESLAQQLYAVLKDNKFLV